MKSFLTILGLIFVQFSFGQDSTKVFTISDFLQTVKEHHPVAKQADLLQDLSRANRRMARGGFDPKIDADWSSKSFDSKNYYSLLSGGLKVPTWYGIDLKMVYDRSTGEFLDNSDFLPGSGLWTAGISVPLGRGLMLDERRAALQRAAIFSKENEQEQLILINELYFNSLQAYLDWYISYRQLEIQEENVNLAQIKFEGTKSSFINGDKPAIDTLESYIEIQARLGMLIEAEQNLQLSRFELENFLWINGNIPLEISQDVIPEIFSMSDLRYNIDALHINVQSLLENHPVLTLYDLKIESLDIDRKLAIEGLKPNLRVDYNPITAASQNTIFDQVNPNNYKLGASISYSLLQRKARGKLQMTKIKIETTDFDVKQKRQGLSIKLNQYYASIQQLREQELIASSVIENYRLMLEAENTKFQLGESSIFLLNSRESKYIQSQLKLIELERKQMQYQLKYLGESMQFVVR